MKLTGVTSRCTQLWNKGATALIGISPFNSYFSTERIKTIIKFCERDARPIVLFIPDDVTRYTLQARGYSPDQSIRKTRRQVQYLRNKISRASGNRELRILGCGALGYNPSY
ncbi:MAG TPA: tRNA-dependent cyclodipeptide synthase, partial [Gammaproteobacteria bacterium]|nr:tRNA-dependent cyclodipeptide synthase [Gammaproteobacteria bacterium]